MRFIIVTVGVSDSLSLTGEVELEIDLIPSFKINYYFRESDSVT